MKIVKNIFLLGLVITLSSLKTPNKQLDKTIVGVWVYNRYTNSNIEYQKKSKFDQNESGIEFKKNGDLIKRQNVGWCGTPPITYGNNNGTWKKTTDSTLTISYKYWGGTVEKDLLIINLNDNKLIVKTLNYRTNEK